MEAAVWAPYYYYMACTYPDPGLCTFPVLGVLLIIKLASTFISHSVTTYHYSYILYPKVEDFPSHAYCLYL